MRKTVVGALALAFLAWFTVVCNRSPTEPSDGKELVSVVSSRVITGTNSVFVRLGVLVSAMDGGSPAIFFSDANSSPIFLKEKTDDGRRYIADKVLAIQSPYQLTLAKNWGGTDRSSVWLVKSELESSQFYLPSKEALVLFADCRAAVYPDDSLSVAAKRCAPVPPDSGDYGDEGVNWICRFKKIRSNNGDTLLVYLNLRPLAPCNGVMPVAVTDLTGFQNFTLDFATANLWAAKASFPINSAALNGFKLRYSQGLCEPDLVKSKFYDPVSKCLFIKP